MTKLVKITFADNSGGKSKMTTIHVNPALIETIQIVDVEGGFAVLLIMSHSPEIYYIGKYSTRKQASNRMSRIAAVINANS